VSNSLQDYLAASGLDEVEAMNELQDHGIISDNCISAAEVGDSGKAVSWLALQTGEKMSRRKR
jgi:hypothetical protein